MIFITTLVYSVLNPINVNSTITGTRRREREEQWKEKGQNKIEKCTLVDS